MTTNLVMFKFVYILITNSVFVVPTKQQSHGPVIARGPIAVIHDAPIVFAPGTRRPVPANSRSAIKKIPEPVKPQPRPAMTNYSIIRKPLPKPIKKP